MRLVEILPKLAAFYYYNSPGVEKGKSFEDLTEDDKRPFLEIAGAALAGLEKMELAVVPKVQRNTEQVEALLRDKIEAAVREFFDGIKVWKKGAIPQQELVARIWQVWKTL